MKKKIALFFLAPFFLIPSLAKAQDVEVEWVQHISGPGDIWSTAIALDHEKEDQYVIANFRDELSVATANGTVTFRPKPKRSASSAYDMLILKLDSAGAILWAKHVGGIGTVEGKSIQADRLNNIYIAGFYEDSTDFDPGLSEALLSSIFYKTGSGDGAVEGYYRNSFLLKLNHEGEFQWVRNLYGKPNEAAGVAIETSNGHIYITGKFKDTIDVNQQSGTDLLVASENATDIFVARFDSSGNYIWAKQMGGNKKNNEAAGIAVDSLNSVYTTGNYTDGADFDPGAGQSLLRGNSPATQNIFISKLDSNGNYVWAKGLSEISGKSSRGLAITNDPLGNVLITGYFTGTMDFDPVQNNSSSVITAGRISCFISKYDAMGNFIWARALLSSGGIGSAQGAAITIDDVGSVYTTGYFANEINMNPDVNQTPVIFQSQSTANGNTFISKLDKDGQYVWAKHFRSFVMNRGYGITVSKERKIYLNGYFGDTVNFNPGGSPIRLTSAGNGDGYIVKLACPDHSDTQLVVNICADQYTLNGEQYDISGIYRQVLRNTSDCDSIITLNLTLNQVIKPVINVEEFVLGVASSYNSYQWIFNDNEIPGATDSTLTVNENGEYRVAVTSDEGCKDTSDVYTVDNVGINDLASLASKINIYPNPTSGLIHLASPINVRVQITNVEGKALLHLRDAKELSLESLSPGVYFIRVLDKNDNLIKVEKVVKQ